MCRPHKRELKYKFVFLIGSSLRLVSRARIRPLPWLPQILSSELCLVLGRIGTSSKLRDWGYTHYVLFLSYRSDELVIVFSWVLFVDSGAQTVSLWRGLQPSSARKYRGVGYFWQRVISELSWLSAARNLYFSLCGDVAVFFSSDVFLRKKAVRRSASYTPVVDCDRQQPVYIYHPSVNSLPGHIAGLFRGI